MSQHDEEGLDENSNTVRSLSLTQKTKSSTRRRIFKNVLNIGFFISINIILPFSIYKIAENFVSEIWAIIIASIPVYIIIAITFICNRRPDISGVIALVLLIIGAVMSYFQNEPKFILLQSSAFSACISVLLLITLIPIRVGSFHLRPLLFYIAKDMTSKVFFGYSGPRYNLPGLTEDEPSGERWERFWHSNVNFRRLFISLTAGWGFWILLEIPIQVLIVYKVDAIDQIILYKGIVCYTWSSVLFLATALYVRSSMKKIKKSHTEDGQMESGKIKADQMESNQTEDGQRENGQVEAATAKNNQ